MNGDTIKTFETDNTAYFECFFKNPHQVLTDPVNPQWKILDAYGNTTASDTPSKKSTGLFFFFWTPTEPGDYVVEFTGTIQSDAIIIRKPFIVIRTSFKGEWSSSSSSSSS